MKKEEIIKRMDELVALGVDASEDQVAEFDKLSADLEKMKASEARAAKLEAEKAEVEKRHVESQRPEIRVTKDESDKLVDTEVHRRAFIKSLAKQELTSKEQRALEAGTAAEGGNVVPTEFDTRVRERIRNINPFRRLGADVIKTSSQRKIPVETTQPSAAIVAEEGAFGESDPAFGQLTLDAYKLGRVVKITDELLADSFIDIESYLIKKFAEAIAAKEEQLIVAGAGTTEPLGLLSTSAVAGVNIANHDITGSATAVTADDLKDMYYTMKPQYRNAASNLVWVMSNDSLAKIAKLKDADNRYLLNDGLRGISAGDDDRLLGKPIIVSDHMQDMAEDDVSFLLVDLKHLLIGDRSGIEVKRLDELYAANGMVGYRFASRFDSLLVNAEAMVTGTNNASA